MAVSAVPMAMVIAEALPHAPGLRLPGFRRRAG
jgi:hypothetical protein